MKAKKPEPTELKALLDPLGALAALFKNSGHRGMVIGGVAAGIWGRSRPTVDVDGMILATSEDLPALIREAAAVGLQPRLPDAIAFARRNRILLLQHPASGRDVDLALGEYPFEVECVERTKNITVEGVTFPVSSPEDIIIGKAVAGRPQDLEDIESIILTQLDLDFDRIRFCVKQFAEALTIPAIFTTVETLLQKAEARKKNSPTKARRRKSSR